MLSICGIAILLLMCFAASIFWNVAQEKSRKHKYKDNHWPPPEPMGYLNEKRGYDEQSTELLTVIFSLALMIGFILFFAILAL